MPTTDTSIDAAAHETSFTASEVAQLDSCMHIERSSRRVDRSNFLRSIASYSLNMMSASTGFRNPVVPGFNPDPSIVRVDGDYFLITSSFEYFPSIPIYHSTDLVNWSLIGHALSRLSQLDLRSCEPGTGIQAPTIRYNKGRFYVTACAVHRTSPANAMDVSSSSNACASRGGVNMMLTGLSSRESCPEVSTSLRPTFGPRTVGATRPSLMSSESTQT